MKQYTTIFLLFFCAQLSLAQTSDTLASFTLKDCMTFAIAHSTKLEIQAADNRDAQISRRDAILRAFTPSISGGTYAALNFGRGVDPETNTYVSTTSFTNGYSVSGSITLFNGFSAVNNIKIAKTAVLMGITREQQLKDELCLAVMQAYCNALYFQQMLHSLNQQVVSAQTNLTLAQQQEQLGQKSRADVIDLEADLADREYQLVSMTNQYNDALLTLKDLMLYPLDQPFAIDTTFNYSALLSNAELEKTRKTILINGALNAKIVGQSDHTIAAIAGFEVPETTKILIGEVESVERTEPFAHEKLSPVLAMYRASSFDDAMDKAQQLLEDGGIRDFACGYAKYRSILAHEAAAKPVITAAPKPKKEKPKGGTKETDKLIRRLEREIEKQEKVVAQYDPQIEAASADYQELTRLLGEKEEAEMVLMDLMEQWEAAQE